MITNITSYIKKQTHTLALWLILGSWLLWYTFYILLVTLWKQCKGDTHVDYSKECALEANFVFGYSFFEVIGQCFVPFVMVISLNSAVYIAIRRRARQYKANIGKDVFKEIVRKKPVKPLQNDGSLCNSDQQDNMKDLESIECIDEFAMSSVAANNDMVPSNDEVPNNYQKVVLSMLSRLCKIRTRQQNIELTYLSTCKSLTEVTNTGSSNTRHSKSLVTLKSSGIHRNTTSMSATSGSAKVVDMGHLEHSDRDTDDTRHVSFKLCPLQKQESDECSNTIKDSDPSTDIDKDQLVKDSKKLQGEANPTFDTIVILEGGAVDHTDVDLMDNGCLSPITKPTTKQNDGMQHKNYEGNHVTDPDNVEISVRRTQVEITSESKITKSNAAIWRDNDDLTACSQGCKSQQNKCIVQKGRKAAITLTILVVVYLLCWTPYHVVLLIETLNSDAKSDAVAEPLSAFVEYLLWLNSAINPFLYVCTNRLFRKELYKMFRCQNIVSSLSRFKSRFQHCCSCDRLPR